MPTDRLLRYTIAGSTLLMSLVFFFLLFGGDTQGIINFFGGDEYLFKIIALILTTPTLGIMVSLIGFQFLVLRQGYKTYYFVPKNKMLIKWILEEKTITTDLETDLRQKLARGDIEGREFEREFYPFYQVKVRKHIKDESLSFIERKWSVIWVHRNIIAAFVISFLLMLPYLAVNYQNIDADYSKISGLIFIFIYVLVAVNHIKYSIRVATKYEHKLLMNALEDEMQKLVESLAIKKADQFLYFGVY